MRDMTRYPEFTMGMDRDSSRYSYRVLIANLHKQYNIDERLVHYEETTTSQAKIGVPGNFLDLSETFAVCGREILYLHTPMFDPASEVTFYLAEREQMGSKKDTTTIYGSRIRSVLDFTTSTTKFDYTASLSISTGDFFNFQMEKGYVQITDNPEKWARYNAQRVYDPRQKKTVVYIFEGMNGTIDRTYTGFLESKTFVKRNSKQLDTIKLTFKDKFFLWDEVEFTKNMVFENVMPKELLMELLGLEWHEVEYINGTWHEHYPIVQSMPTKGYKTYIDFLKAYAKSGVRFSFDAKEKLVIFSDTIMDDIVATNSIPINETLNITDITEDSKNQYIYNDINAEVVHRRPWKNIDEFGGADNVQYTRFLGDPIQVNHTLVEVGSNQYSNVYNEVSYFAPTASPLDSYEVTKHYDEPVAGDYIGSLIRYDNSEQTQIYRKSSTGLWAWKDVEDALDEGETEWFATGKTSSANTGKTRYTNGQEISGIDKYKRSYGGDYEYRWIANGDSIQTNTDAYYTSEYRYRTNMKEQRRKVRIRYNYSGKLYKEVWNNYSMNILSVVDANLVNHVTYGDYVLLKDNRANDAQANEFYGKVGNIIPDENKVEIILGNFDKDYRLLFRGKMDWFFSMGYNESQSFTLHYGKVELPIVWKYAREFQSGTRDYDLNYPIIPNIVNADGDNVEESTKEIYAEFGFAKDLDDETYAGYVTHIDRLWSEVISDDEVNPEFVWFKEKDLKYNRELEQSKSPMPPIYVLSNTIDQKNFKNSRDSYIEYDYFDNRNIEVGVVVPNTRFLEPNGKESEMRDSDAIVKIRNTNTILDTEIIVDTPINMMGNTVLEVTDTSSYSVGDVLRLQRVERVVKPIGSSYTEAEIVQNEQAEFYESHYKLRWTVTSVFEDSDSKKYVMLDMDYPIAISKLEKHYFTFEKFPYHKNVFLQEMYIRGNPVVEKTEEVRKKNYESIDVYGKKSFTVDASFLTKDDVYRLIDYYYQNFDGLTRETTKLRIPMKIWYGSIFLDKLDVISFRDMVFTGIDETTKWMVTKKTPKDIELVNISRYSGNADNVDRNETVIYEPETLPEYNHTGGEGGPNNKVDTTTKTISKEDETVGTLGLVEIPLNQFSAKIDVYADDVNNQTSEAVGMLTLKDVTGNDQAIVDKYTEMFFEEPGVEFIVKVDNTEFIQIRTVYDKKGYVTHRALFETDKVTMGRGKIVQFYAIASKVNEDGLSTHALLVGNESGNHLKYDKGELTVVAKNIDMQSGNINIENTITGDKMKILSTPIEGEYSNELLIGTATGSSTNFQVGNLDSNSMLRLNDTRADIVLGQNSVGTYQLALGNPTIDITDILQSKFGGQYTRLEILNDYDLYSQLTTDEYWRLKNYQKYMHFNGDVFQIGANVEVRGFTDVDFDKIGEGKVDISFDELNKMYVQSTMGMTQLTGNAVKVFQTPESPQLLTSFGYMDRSKELEATEFVRIGKNAVPIFNQDGNRTDYKDGMWIGDLSNIRQDMENYMTYSADDGLFVKGNFTLVSSGKSMEQEIKDSVDQGKIDMEAYSRMVEGILKIDNTKDILLPFDKNLCTTGGVNPTTGFDSALIDGKFNGGVDVRGTLGYTVPKVMGDFVVMFHFCPGEEFYHDNVFYNKRLFSLYNNTTGESLSYKEYASEYDTCRPFIDLEPSVNFKSGTDPHLHNTFNYIQNRWYLMVFAKIGNTLRQIVYDTTTDSRVVNDTKDLTTEYGAEYVTDSLSNFEFDKIVLDEEWGGTIDNFIVKDGILSDTELDTIYSLELPFYDELPKVNAPKPSNVTMILS